MLRIKIKDWYDIHSGYTLSLQPGVTALVGPNGAGKTTLLTQLRDYAKNTARAKRFKVLDYSNIVDGGDKAMQSYLSSGDMTRLATSMTSSEGERIIVHLSCFVPKIKPAIEEVEREGKTLLILIDAIDSGMSIDKLRDIAGMLNMIAKDIEGKNVYLVISTNNYELAKGRCLNPRTGKYVSFGSYAEYADFICSFKKLFAKGDEKE